MLLQENQKAHVVGRVLYNGPQVHHGNHALLFLLSFVYKCASSRRKSKPKTGNNSEWMKEFIHAKKYNHVGTYIMVSSSRWKAF